MLLNDFFTFTNLQTTEGATIATIHLNGEHSIFKGHFPGQPIVPGVCMMQMVKEVLEVQLHTKLRLQKASDLKFLSFIDPVVNATIQLELKISNDAELTRVDARLLDGGVILFKLKAAFSAY